MMEQQQDCIRRNPVMCRYQQQQQQQQQQNDYKLDIASSASQGQSSMGKNIQIPTKLQHNHALHHVQIERANTAASMGSGSQETSCTAAATASLVSIAVYLTNDLCLMMDVKRNASAQHIINLIQSDPELALARTSSFGLNCNAQQQQQQPVFALWLVSAQLEIQLRPTHKPLELATKWPRLVNKYCRYLRSNGNDSEPLLYFRRNVFLSRRDEEKIKEPKILELLYAEAKENVLKGRYPCESQARYINLGALQCRIELGVYNPGFHTLNFLRKNRDRFLPHHFDIPLLGRLGLVGGKGSPEARLLEHYKRIPAQAMSVQTANANPRKFIRKYLEFCWNLPCYGAAFFRGQIERPVRGLTSWIINRDMDVLVAINNIGVYIVDNAQCSLLLGLRYSELNWEMAKPSDEGNPDCLPCLFLQFPVRENGERVYKILQVFSRQAMMMDTLISGFAEENRHIEESEDNANANNRPQDNSFMTNLANVGSFTNKLSKLTLATFDDEGRCIGQMGSWSFQ